MDKSQDIKIVFPLDVSTLRAAYALMEEVGEYIDVVKVGLQIMTSVTQSVAINIANDFNKECFADTKLIDIPNTIYETAKAIVRYVPYGLRYFNVMALGMEKMMVRAVEGAQDGAKELGVSPPKIIAVHYLTSTDVDMLRKAGLSVPPGMTMDPLDEQMSWLTLQLAKMSVNAGIDILLTSAREAPILNKAFPEKEIWSPGIRFPWDPSDDQKRTMTPGEAYKNGVKGLVIGRPIRNPGGGKTRREVVEEIYADINRHSG